MPFVQGQLLNKNLTFTLQTECAHCQQPIQIEIGSELDYRVLTEGAQPLVYTPLLDVNQLEPSIIDGF